MADSAPHSDLQNMPGTNEPDEAERQRFTAHCDQSPPRQAVEIAKNFTQRWPTHPLGWTLLAENHYRLGDYAAAVSAAEQAARLDPHSASAHSNLGVMLKKLERLTEAEAALRCALICDSNFFAAYVNLGNVLRELDRFAEAEAVCRHALALAPERIEPRNNLANVLKDAGRADEAAALYRDVFLKSSTRIRRRSLPVTPSQVCDTKQTFASAWMVADGRWTTSSSSDCGAQ